VTAPASDIPTRNASPQGTSDRARPSARSCATPGARAVAKSSGEPDRFEARSFSVRRAMIVELLELREQHLLHGGEIGAAEEQDRGERFARESLAPGLGSSSRRLHRHDVMSLPRAVEGHEDRSRRREIASCPRRRRARSAPGRPTLRAARDRAHRRRSSRAGVEAHGDTQVRGGVAPPSTPIGPRALAARRGGPCRSGSPSTGRARCPAASSVDRGELALGRRTVEAPFFRTGGSSRRSAHPRRRRRTARRTAKARLVGDGRRRRARSSPLEAGRRSRSALPGEEASSSSTQGTPIGAVSSTCGRPARHDETASTELVVPAFWANEITVVLPSSPIPRRAPLPSRFRAACPSGPRAQRARRRRGDHTVPEMAGGSRGRGGRSTVCCRRRPRR